MTIKLRIRLWQVLSTSWLSFLAPMVKADEHLLFKQEMVLHQGWLTYITVLVVMFILILFLAKKNKSTPNQIAGCQLLEKKHLGNKTVLYILEYQQQRFMLADNQQTMTLHPLTHEKM